MKNAFDMPDALPELQFYSIDANFLILSTCTNLGISELRKISTFQMCNNNIQKNKSLLISKKTTHTNMHTGRIQNLFFCLKSLKNGGCAGRASVLSQLTHVHPI